MSITLEEIERLREKADVSYEEARAALERSGGDLLEALIDLERQGKIRASGQGGTYSTRPGSAGPSAAPERGGTQSSACRDGQTTEEKGAWKRIKELLRTGLNIISPSTRNLFEIWRDGRMLTSIPILILIIAFICIFWITVLLLLLGLVLGCRYRFSGPDLGREKVNSVMDAVSDTAADMRETVRREFGRKDRRK